MRALASSSLALAIALFGPSPARAAGAGNTADIANRFCAAIASGNLREFQKLADRPAEIQGRGWESVRELVERYEQIRIAASSTSLDPVSGALVVELDATGIAHNALHRREPVPRLWYLTLSPDAKTIATAVDGAGRLVDELVAGDEKGLSRASADEVAAAARRLVDLARRTKLSEVRAVGSAIIRWCFDHHASDAESFAYSALALAEKTGHDDAAAARFADVAVTIASGASCDAAASAELVSALAKSDRAERSPLLEAAAARAEAMRDPRAAMEAVHTEYNDSYTVFDIAAAARSLDRLEALAGRFGNRPFELRALASRASMAAAVDDYDRAIRLASRAAALAHDIDVPAVEAHSLTVLGLSSLYRWRSAEDGVQAREAFEKALALRDAASPELQTYIHSGLGMALVGLGRAEEAEQHLQAAVALARQTGRHMANAAVLGQELREKQGRYAEAIAYTREGIRQYKEEGLWMTWALKGTLGRLLIECGDLDEGVEELHEAIDLIEARWVESTSSPLTRAHYFSNSVKVYAQLTDALIRQKRIDDALAVAERMRARSLIDAIQATDSHAPLTSEEHEHQRELGRRVADLNRDLLNSTGTAQDAVLRHLRAARNDLDDFNLEIAERYPRHVAPEGSIKDKDLSHLPTVLEYVVLPDSIGVFLVRKGKVDFVRLSAKTHDVDERTKHLLQMIEKRDYRFAADARSLYDDLVAPLAGRIGPRESFTIIPDQFLWRVPFDALMDRRHRYLAVDHAIAYAPSITLLARSRAVRPNVRGTLLAFGDPHLSSATARQAARYRDLSLRPLPDARDEVRALSHLYPGADTEVLTGAEATESTFKRIAGNYRILHLATHGIVEDGSPLYSAVVLARSPGDADDGLLEMREVRDLHLHADLVVLSACDTARGDVYSGEGVVGLSWAFLSAGCGATVVSQWKADSHTTTGLMVEFHRQLLGGARISQALRRAQLRLIADARYYHPFYWAPFIVVGNDERLDGVPRATER